MTEQTAKKQETTKKGVGKKEKVPYEDMHPFLRELIDEHEEATLRIKKFEFVLNQIREKGLNQNKADQVSSFFDFFDNNILVHNEKEDQRFFPLLQERLRANEIYEKEEDKLTAVDLLKKDHIKAVQLGAVCFNLFGLALRLPDTDSRIVTLDLATEQSKELADTLNHHIGREEDIALPLAHQHLTQEELDHCME